MLRHRPFASSIATLAKKFLLPCNHVASSNDAWLASPCMSNQWCVTSADLRCARERVRASLWPCNSDQHCATKARVRKIEIERERDGQRRKWPDEERASVERKRVRAEGEWNESGMGKRGSELTKRERVMKGREARGRAKARVRRDFLRAQVHIGNFTRTWCQKYCFQKVGQVSSSLLFYSYSSFKPFFLFKRKKYKHLVRLKLNGGQQLVGKVFWL